MDAISLTGAERGFLMLIDDYTGELHGADCPQHGSRDHRTIVLDEPQHHAERGPPGEPIVTINAQSDPAFPVPTALSATTCRPSCVPLKVRGTITGVIYADNRIAAGIFNDDDRDLLNFANQAAVAIKNARLFKQIRDQLADITEMKNLMDDVFASIASGRYYHRHHRPHCPV